MKKAALILLLSSSLICSSIAFAQTNIPHIYNIPLQPYKDKYQAQLFIGNNSIWANVDTGSSTLIIPQEAIQITGQLSKWQLKNSYGNGGLQSVYHGYKTNVNLQNIPPVPLMIGVQTSGNMHPVIGMARSAPTGTRRGRFKTYFDTLVSHGMVANQFSVLLCGDQGGSKLTLGGIDSRVNQSSKQTVPLIFAQHYLVLPTYLGVAGSNEKLGYFSSNYQIRRNQITLDTGTIGLVLSTPMYRHVVNLMIRTARENHLRIPRRAWHNRHATLGLTAQQISLFPTLTIVFQQQNVILQIPPENYLLPSLNHPGKYKFVIYPPLRNRDYILGTSLFQSYYVNINRAASEVNFYSNQGLCG